MWPLGNETKSREVSRAYIANDFKTSAATKGELGSYDAQFMNIYDNTKIWRTGRAENINRQKRGVWDILYLCLKSIGMEKRNK